MIPTSRLVAITLAIFSLPLALHATDPSVDGAFENTISPGITPDGYPTFNTGTGAVNAVALQSTGKILVGGNISRYQAPPAGSPQSSLKRLNSDGTLDSTFGAIASTLADSQGQTEVNAILRVAGDKLYVGGVFTSYNGSARAGVLRLNADGSLDTDFAPVGGITNSNAFGMRYVLALAEQADGKLLVAGGYNRANGTARPGLARFNSDGSLDTSFNPSPALPTDTSAQDIAVLPNGQILVAGGKPRVGGGYVPLLVRLNADGSLDSSLAPSFTDTYGDIDELLVLPDGRILIGGDFAFAPTGTQNYIACLQPDGTVDTAFMANLGTGPNGWAGGELMLQPDGTIFVGGIFNKWNNQPRASIARLNPDGTLDAAFAVSPYTADRNNYLTHFYSFAVQPDGKLLAGGWFNRISVANPSVENYNLTRFVNEYAPGQPGTVRFLATQITTAENAGTVALQISRFGGLTGAISVNFVTGGNGGTAVSPTDYTNQNTTVSWADGEGGIKTVNVPLATDGTVDGSKTFVATLSAASGNPFIPAGAAQATVTIRDADAAPEITASPASVSLEQGAGFTLSVRYNSVLAATLQWQRDPDGAGPLPFSNIGGAASTSYSVTVADPALHAGDYRVVITNANGSTTSSPATVSIAVPTGSVVTAFAPAVGTPISTAAAQDSSGRFLLVGSTGVRRLGSDGTLEPTTSFGISVSGATSVLPLADGRTLIGGNFTLPITHQPSNTTSNVSTRLIRLNADATGTIDTSYAQSIYGPVATIVPGASGKFYVGSSVTLSGAGGNIGVQRFLANGNVDTTFAPPFFAAAGTYAVKFIYELSPTQILVAYNNSGDKLARFNVGTGSPYAVTLDTTFATAGIFSLTGGNLINGLDVLPDGRIAITTFFSNLISTDQQYVGMFNANGTPDTTFKFNSVLGGRPKGVAYRDGRLLVWGEFTTVNGADPATLVRINLDGSVDPNLSIGVGAANPFDRTINRALFTATGEIFIAGKFNDFKGVPRNNAALLVGNPQIGAIGFAPARVTALEDNAPLTLTLRRYGTATEAASISYATQPDTATAGVDFTATSGTVSWAAGDTADKTISIPLLDNATISANRSFRVVLSSPVGPASPAASATVTLIDDDTPVTITAQPIASASLYETQTLALSVTASSPSGMIYQWFRNGVAIPGATAATYNVASVVGAQGGVYHVRVTNAAGTYLSAPSIVTVRPQPGRIAAGQATLGRPFFNSSPTGLVVANDGYVYVGGPFTANAPANVPQSYFIRVKPDGSTDTAYTYTPGSNITAMARQADGKILLAGSFTGRVVRLNADGTVDSAFTTALGSSLPAVVISDFAFDSTGRIYLGGASYLARLSSTGALDTAYTPAVVGNINALAIQSNDKLIAAGTFTSLAGSAAPRLGRLETNGTRDTTYTGSLASSTPNDLLILADGRVLVAMGGTTTLAQLSDTGAQISTFASTDQVYQIAQAPGGKILATRTGTSGSNRVFRLLGTNPFPVPGSTDLDSTFTTGTGPDADARVLTVGPDGSVWIAGLFSSVNSVATQGIARLNGDPLNPAIVNAPTNTGVAPGGTAYLGVGASGTGLSYQWFKNGNPLTDGGNISGSTSAILTISNASAGDDADYTVAVTGGSPLSTVTSSPAHLYLLGAPLIVTQPAVPTSVFVGQSITFAPEVFAAAPATYQWSRDGVALTDSANVSGSATASLTLPSAAQSQSGTYTLTITNSQGTATTTPVYLLVRPLPSARAYSGLSSSNTVTALHTLPNGAMLVASLSGTLTNNSFTNLTSRLHLVQPDGTVANLGFEPTFGTALPALGTFQVSTILRQSDGKILLGGNVPGFGAYLARYFPDGNADPSFTPGSGGTTGANIRALAFDDSGRLMVGGDFTNFNGVTNQNALVRLDATTGALDATFSAGLTSSSVASILKLPGVNSGFIVGGNLLTPFQNYIFRYDGNGARVTSYSSTVNSTPSTLALTPDGTGFYTTLGSQPYLQRYRVTDGALDSTFTVASGTFNNTISSLAVQADGKILAHGAFTLPSAELARILPNGAPDTAITFLNNQSSTHYPLALDPAGRIWVGGSFTTFNAVTANRIAVFEGDFPSLAWSAQPYDRAAAAGATLTFTAQARATSAVTYQWFKNGSPLANSARISGVNTTTLTITGATVGDEGLYTATATTANPAATITSAPGEFVFLGAPEITIAPTGGTFEAGVSRTLSVIARGAGALTYQWFRGSATTPVVDISGANSANYTIAAPTTADTFYYGVRVTNSLGSVSSTPVLLTFANYAGGISSATASFNNTVNTVIPLADSSYVVAGNFTIITPVGGTATTRRGIARILANGTIDTAFSAVVAPTSSLNLSDLVRDSQGRYIVIGNFSSLSTTSGVGLARNSIARLDATGAPDTGFTSPLPAAVATLNCLAVDSSDRVYIGGSFTSFGGTAGINYLVRLDATTGARDSTFTAGNTGTVNCVRILGDGNLLVGSQSFGLLRLTGTGAVDGTFSYAGGLAVTAITPVPASTDFIITGSSGGVQRITANGSVVAPWPASGTTANSSVTELLPLSGGTYLIGGAFTTYNNITANRIAQLNANGTLGSGFNFGTGFSGGVTALATDANNRIFVGGGFSTYKDATANRLVILNGVTTIPTDPGAPVVSDPLADFLANAGVPVNLRGPNDDADSDGLSNLLEYALDLNPNGNGGGSFTGSIPALATTPTLLQFTYRRVRNDVTYVVETSPTLIGGTWTSVGVTQGTPGPDGTTTASIPVTPGSQFLRLSVTR